MPHGTESATLTPEGSTPKPARRRWMVGLVIMTGWMMLPGCAYLRETFRPKQTFDPQQLNCSADDIVRQINGELGRVSSWRSSDVSIRTTGVPLRLSADLAVQAPRNFRLMVKSPGGVEADFGSNSERFWFWTRRVPSPAVLTARHEQVHLIQERMQIPFQPEWLMEVLGVVPLPEGRFVLQTHNTGANSAHLNLVAEEQGPRGERFSRTLLVDPRTRRIAAHLLQDDKGTIIARAALSDYRLDRRTGITTAHRMDLEWPQAPLKMTLFVGKIELNPESFPDQLWNLPRIAGSPVVDLGRIQAADAGPGRASLNRFERGGEMPAPAQGQSHPGPLHSASIREDDPPWAADGPFQRTAEGPPGFGK